MAQSRKWLITINNPIEHGFDHARIKAAVNDLPALLYWCMCDEKGDECETLHTHVYFVCENGLTHTQVDARFPSFHRDIARGKSSENRAYVLKDGAKFNKQPDGSYSYKDTGGHLHEGVNFSDTFEEGGEMPAERQGKSRDADIIVNMIKEGASNEEIVNAVASAYRDIEKVERVHSMYRDAQFKNCWRELEVTYIFGKTGSGKTRGVMDRYSPIWPDGIQHSCNIYAHTREECEKKLKVLITEMNEERKNLKEQLTGIAPPTKLTKKQRKLWDYMRLHPEVTEFSTLAKQTGLARNTVKKHYGMIAAMLGRA